MSKTPDEWAELVEEWRGSRQTARAFAAAHGIAESALRYWAGRLARDGRPRSSPRPRPASRPAGPAPSPTLARVVRPGDAPPAKSDGRITIVVGKVSIVVERGFDGAQFREVVRILSEVG